MEDLRANRASGAWRGRTAQERARQAQERPRREACRAAPRRHVARLTAAAALCSLPVAACGAESYGATRGAPKPSRALARLVAPLRQSPPRPEQPIVLRDARGRAISLASYHGRAVLLTFIYDHCPDACPLIVAKLHTALGLLGARAREAQVVAVSVDPRGDTPASANAFLASHRMAGRMEYLLGSARVLAPIWRAWGIAVHGNPSTREVGHTAAVFGIDASGDVAALYPASFTAQAIAHDVPLLAAS